MPFLGPVDPKSLRYFDSNAAGLANASSPSAAAFHWRCSDPAGTKGGPVRIC